MRETLQLGCKCSLFITISIINQVKNIIILLLLLISATVEKMLQTRRLSAWVVNIITHQRLNVEHLITKLIESTDFSLPHNEKHTPARAASSLDEAISNLFLIKNRSNAAGGCKIKLGTALTTSPHYNPKLTNFRVRPYRN